MWVAVGIGFIVFVLAMLVVYRIGYSEVTLDCTKWFNEQIKLYYIRKDEIDKYSMYGGCCK